MTRPPGAPVGRIHQEDLLGALGLDPLLKYERPQQQRHTPAGGFAPAEVVTARGGPDLVALAGLLATHLGRARLATLLQAVAVNRAAGTAEIGRAPCRERMGQSVEIPVESGHKKKK